MTKCRFGVCPRKATHLIRYSIVIRANKIYNIKVCKLHFDILVPSLSKDSDFVIEKAERIDLLKEKVVFT